MVRTEIPAIDGASALLATLRRHFAGCRLTAENIRSRPWTSAAFRGGRHELVILLEGARAGALADAFVADPPRSRLNLADHVLCDLIPGTAVRACRGSWARIAIEALTVENPPLESPTVVPDPDVRPSGMVVAVRGRDGQPFFLLGSSDGAIVITNADPYVVLASLPLKLYRFRTEAQARAAAAVIEQHALLDVDGETWFVREARRPTAAPFAELVRWAVSLDADIAAAVRPHGPGAYPFLSSRSAA